MIDENQEILIRLGEVLRQIRKEKSMSLLELEIASGVSEGALSKIENGKKKLAFTTFYKIARGLALQPKDILERM